VPWAVSAMCAVAPPAGLYGVVGTGVPWAVSATCAVAPPAGLYGVVGTGVPWAVSALCAVVPPPGLYGVVGTGLLWEGSPLCAVVPPPGLYGMWILLDGSCPTTPRLALLGFVSPCSHRPSTCRARSCPGCSSSARRADARTSPAMRTRSLLSQNMVSRPATHTSMGFQPGFEQLLTGSVDGFDWVQSGYRG
jgi:hypothetical protein